MDTQTEELTRNQKFMQLAELWRELTGEEAIPVSARQREEIGLDLIERGFAHRCAECGTIVGN